MARKARQRISYGQHSSLFMLGTKLTPIISASLGELAWRTSFGGQWSRHRLRSLDTVGNQYDINLSKIADSQSATREVEMVYYAHGISVSTWNRRTTITKTSLLLQKLLHRESPGRRNHPLSASKYRPTLTGSTTSFSLIATPLWFQRLRTSQ